ncbi:anthocyanidin 3-O-glucosyltransferase 2-like isoform X3 [Juglans microcarpa x Juglans regia]|uniref:anthocyanidin 3-O-glucosyltransferase 2-like isoform X3 n=1 Tax=Juglans microcarpa x Juglans regia TaxID=2249226 RepID=UPI001B7ECA17|nr:anthocyanidin 3-O-glucosyltransferase 2-like isoform X3 [Juglans microcarpa x Juglans regia]
MKRAELVFIPTPGMGHLASTLAFAKHLLDRDDRFSITVLVMNPAFAPTNHSIVQLIAASDTRVRFIHLPQVDPPPKELFFRSVEKFITEYVENYKSHVKEAIINHVLSASLPLAGLVVDLFCSSMINVAHELGVPSYVFFTTNAAFSGFMLYLPTRHDQVGIEFRETDPESVIPSYVNPVPPGALSSFALNKEGGYICNVNLGRKYKEADGIIINTFSELESHAVSSFFNDGIPPVYTVGPMIDLKGKTSSEDNQAKHEIMKWLDDQPPSSVVFLCFGSRGSFGEPQLKETALGLERSGHRFLWSVRLPSRDDGLAKPTDAENLEEILPPGFLERTRGIGMICGWAPQVEVLAHKAIGGFVSHCGWNSILESLWHGVPIATWPLYAEQQTNAFQMVRDLGLAVELKINYRLGSGVLVMAEEIENAVKCLMEADSEVRKRVKEMSIKSRQAVIEGGSSYASLGRLIEAIIANVTVPARKSLNSYVAPWTRESSRY